MPSSPDNFKLPSVVAAHILPDPLESLHSPAKQETFLDRRSRRSSLASDFNDIALDDDNFSPVALTARPNPNEQYDEDDIASPRPPSQASSTLKSHKKTASTTTIRSLHEQQPGTVFAARADIHEQAGRARASLDGQLKLKEEFARLQEQDSKEHNVTENTIDWGTLWALPYSHSHFIPEFI